MKRLPLRLALVATLLTGTLAAQVPLLINYQGRVAVDAVNFDGVGQFRFALVDGAGTITYWSNDGTSTAGSQPTGAIAVTVTKGLYSVLLGDTALANMTAVPASLFNATDVRLRVWFNDGINGSQLLTPDQRIAAVGYAMMAANVPAGAITSAKIADGAIGPAQLAPGAVGPTQLANNAVGSAQLAPGAVGPTQLASNALGGAQLADGSINAGKIAPGAISGDRWMTIAASGLAARNGHTAVWTGSEIIIWGGYGGSYLNDGARYNPVLNAWTAVNTTGAPAARASHTAIWTGSEMIVWGGVDATGHRSDGGRYNPVTNTWSTINPSGAPAARRDHTAVWTGSEMIVWGGGIGGGIQGVTKFKTGGRYRPSSDTWTDTNLPDAPAARYLHTAVWTGTEMVVWGGLGTGFLSDGARYNPVSNTWAVTNSNSAPAPRSSHTAVWTGTRMIVFGGSGVNNLNDGASYDPAANTWTAIAGASVPRFSHTAVWTGSEMIVWGGSSGAGELNTGERFDPAANSWMAFSATGAPDGRSGHAAIWNGTEIIVWGGAGSNFLYGDGARLRLSNILVASIGGGQLTVPLQLIGATASGNILSGTNTAVGGTGVAGVSTGGSGGVGVAGDGGSGGTGVKGVASGFSGTGVSGINASGTGVYGESTSDIGVWGTTKTGTAVFGYSIGSGLAGDFFGNVRVLGKLSGERGGQTGGLVGDKGAIEGWGNGGSTGVYGTSFSAYPGGYAGWFDGNVKVTGSLVKGGGAFQIDHPLDPANRYLSHSFVESPDMMNIYNGNITLDTAGEAVIELPEWFGALNKEFRYQLTCLGGFAPVYIAEEIADNHFKIAGGKPGLKVSWQVTGIRQDAWANAHRIIVEENKPAKERGFYLHPELFDQPAEKSVEPARNSETPRPTDSSPASSANR